MIGLIGLNHKSAPLEIRERFVFCEEDIRRFIPQLKSKGIQGAVVVSTCNRTEIYFEYENNNDHLAFDLCEDTMFKHREVDNSVKRHFYRKYHSEAVRHLFNVVSGLDSMAFGEYQIVGQIKDAFCYSVKHKLSSPILVRLFNNAFKASKRVRTGTALNKGAVSISYAAVEVARKRFENFTSLNVLLLGAGETGELTLQSLIKKGCTNFKIVNRTYEKAVDLAKKYNGSAVEIENLGQLLETSDLVICSTASKKPLILDSMVEDAMKARNNKPIFFIDLSVPRNVSYSVSCIENATVFDIDSLNGVIEENLVLRKGELNKAEHIINELVTDFIKWHNCRSLSPLFQNISTSIHEVNKSELESFIRNSSDKDYIKASEYGEVITNKIIRLMIRNVKSITDNGQKQEYISIVNRLFEQN